MVAMETKISDPYPKAKMGIFMKVTIWTTPSLVGIL